MTAALLSSPPQCLEEKHKSAIGMRTAAMRRMAEKKMYGKEHVWRYFRCPLWTTVAYAVQPGHCTQFSKKRKGLVCVTLQMQAI